MTRFTPTRPNRPANRVTRSWAWTNTQSPT